jgi:hypothetical protein
MRRAQDPDAYVFEVRDSTRRYIEELLNANEKLRETTHNRNQEIETLQIELAAARTEIDSRLHNQIELARKVDEIENENERFGQQYVEIERQNADLANLYVATHRLHSTLDRDEVVAVIQEIVINLIGSEELAVFEIGCDSSDVKAIGAMGIEPDRLDRLARGIAMSDGVIGKCVQAGEQYVKGDPRESELSDDEAGLTASVPLVLEGRVTGAITVFNLLGQKPGLEPVDLQLFDLLASHAATALHCTRMRDEASKDSSARG